MKDKVVEQTDDPLVIDGSVFSIQHEALLMDIKEGGKPDLMTVHSPGSAVVEQYKELFMALDRACQPAGKKIIAVTSAMQGEGKTATVANLAVVAARNFGKKCLLVDTHFKRPFIANLFRLGRGLGLIDVMMQRRSLEDVLTRSSVDNLTLLPMGHFLGKRAEVLNVGGLKDVFTKIRGEYYNILWNEDCDDFLQMEQQETDLFDYIFVDSPPASSPEMAIIEKAADALLLVVRAESVPRESVQQAVERLDSSKLIGAVLNFAQTSAHAPNHKYWYYR